MAAPSPLPPNAVLACSGFVVTFAWLRFGADRRYVDVSAEIEFFPRFGGTLRSAPFWISAADLHRLAAYLRETSRRPDCEADFAFVPLELGFELRVFDFDPESDSALLEIRLNLGRDDEGRRVYGGASSTTSSGGLEGFAASLEYAARVLRVG